MTTMNATMDVSANRPGAASCIEKHETCSVQDILLSHVKGLAGRKVWAVVSEILGLGERAAKARLSGSRAFTADELAHLLRQEQGRELLVALMGDAKPAWWVRFLQYDDALATRKEVLRSKRRLERMMHAVDENLAAFERAENALAVQDPEFAGAQFDGYRAAARVSNRALAQKARR
jgi:hypothetical protein